VTRSSCTELVSAFAVRHSLVSFGCISRCEAHVDASSIPVGDRQNSLHGGSSRQCPIIKGESRLYLPTTISGMISVLLIFTGFCVLEGNDGLEYRTFARRSISNPLYVATLVHIAFCFQRLKILKYVYWILFKRFHRSCVTLFSIIGIRIFTKPVSENRESS
jgi:hypothetical protein